jgi:AcrR family transcriptional regulator
VRDPKQRLWLAVDAIVGEWSRDPKAARLMLIEAYKAGPTAVKQAQRASRSIEAGVGGSLDGDLEGAAIPPLIAEGIASGLTSVARSQLLSKRQEPLTGLGDALGSWALSYLSPAATQLEELDRSLRPQGGQVEFSPSAVSSRGAGGDVALQPHGDRLLLLSAVAKLAVVEGQGDLTPGRILAAAGVSRRSFDANFAHVEDCFSAALELYAGEAIARAKQTTGRKGLTPAGAACQAVTSLCVQVAQDSVFASLCFGGIATTVVRTMRSHERFMADIACLAEGGEILVDERAGKASAGALWGVLHNAVTMGRAQRVPQISATLAYLMLAPAFGASATLEAMREEHGLLAA